MLIFSYPDCCFVEDPCVIIGRRVVLNNMRALSRRGEVDAIEKRLSMLEEFEFVHMKGPAFLDGGDVLDTGKDILVGISTRSNKEGAEVLQNAFPNRRIFCFEVTRGLHLKSFVSLLDEKTFVVAGNEEGRKFAAAFHCRLLLQSVRDEGSENEQRKYSNREQQEQQCPSLTLHSPSLPLKQGPINTTTNGDLLNALQAEVDIDDCDDKYDGSYDFIFVPDVICSNVLRVRDALLVQDGFPTSLEILSHVTIGKNLKLIPLMMSEMIKADGALTCCSLLIH